MARQESDREDILREATALVERVELELAGSGAPLVAGFRRDGSVSLFWGPDKVYQFNTTCELRRGYLDGRLTKAERGRLIALTRVRGESAVQLVRHSFNEREVVEYLAALQSDLAQLRQALECGEVRVAGQVPEQADVVGRLLTWLGSLPSEIAIADSPHAR